MKISLNWIKEFTDVTIPIDELVKKIGSQLGEVEEVINLGERYEGILVAKVVSCERHPNADKLNVCLIDDGKVAKSVERNSEGLVQVVCGAPNVRKGITVAWIPPGAIVPSSFDSEQFTLEARPLRGVISNGMLASGKELAVNEDHEGLLVLDKPAEPGELFKEVYKLDDYIIDIENKMFTHRPDCFGQLGIAREIAGIQGIRFTSPEWYLEALDAFNPTAEKRLKLTVENKVGELVPRFMAIPISDITVGRSPLMVQSFLYRVGIKPINNVVDITNFVMALTAQPMHAYDYDKVAAQDKSDSATLIVRKPKKGETIALLNGKTIEPRPDAIMIATEKRLIGVGGVMGGTDTEVDADTKNIILECATFDMYSIRRTAMTHGLFTDAVTRFNKGQSPLQNPRVMAYAIAWVQKLAHGHVAGKLEDVVNCADINVADDGWNDREVQITSDFVNTRLGSNFTLAQIKKILSNVEFGFDAKKEGVLTALSPFWRTDIEIAEDVVEEVGRLHGYDTLPKTLPKRDSSPISRNSLLHTKSHVRQELSAAGANEVLTYSFVHGKLLDGVGQNKESAFELTNAISPELQYYRVSILPSLLEKVYANLRAGFNEFALFEVNKAHDKSRIHEDGLPIEAEHVALVFAADKKAQTKYTGSPYYQAKVYVEELLATFGIRAPIYEPIPLKQDAYDKQVLAPFEPSRTAVVKTQDGKLLGFVGEVRTAVKQNLKLPNFVAGFEINLQMLEAYGGLATYHQLSRFPSTQQDISLKVNSDVTYNEVVAVLQKALDSASSAHGYVTQVSAVDIYQEDSKSKNITVRVTLSHPERTLVKTEVNTLMGSLAEAAKSSLSAKRL